MEEDVCVQQVGALILPPSQAGSWFWEQSPSIIKLLLLQDRVVISRLSMEIIPPVVFAPELLQESVNWLGQNWAEGPF